MLINALLIQRQEAWVLMMKQDVNNNWRNKSQGLNTYKAHPKASAAVAAHTRAHLGKLLLWALTNPSWIVSRLRASASLRSAQSK